MKKPLDLVYGVADTPPMSVMVVGGLQHIGLMAGYLVVPVIVAREGGAAVTLDILGLSLLALGAGAILQALPRGPVGSGLLCPPTFVFGFLPVSLLAVRSGGLPLLFGMTIELRELQRRLDDRHRGDQPRTGLRDGRNVPGAGA